MSGALSRSRVSSEQVDVLVSFMEEHPEFAAGKLSVYSRFTASKLWRLLAERLNAAAGDSGGAHKSPDKWCRFWADLKYKARKKAAAAGALGDLSPAEERVQNIFNSTSRDSGGGGGGEARAGEESERKHSPAEDDMCSEGGTAPGGAAGEAPRLATEELLAEAAMRSALAAEKQAEAVAQAVELLRELVALVRERAPPDHLAPLHHHRL